MQIEQISEQLFKVIKGYGHPIQMFTSDGKATISPNEARRFYIKDLKIMVTFINDESISEFIINLSAGIDVKKIKPMLTAIRTLATSYLIEYTIKSFGKEIAPKDFAYQAKNVTEQVAEGFSKWSGSARKSYQKLNDACILIKHKKSVDENIRGARTRQIEAIFIENAAGERFLFSSTNIPAARAMLKHVNEGGTPYDPFGKHIMETLNEYKQLRIFERYNNRRGFFEDASRLPEEIHNKIVSLHKLLKHIAGQQGYTEHFKNFKALQTDTHTAQERLNELTDNVTVHYFDEAITASLPYVAKIIETVNKRDSCENDIKDLAQLANDGRLEFTSTINADDPENPTNIKYADAASRASATCSHVARFVKGSYASNLLMNASEHVYNVSPDFIAMAEKAANTIKKYGSVKERVEYAGINTTELEVQKITEALSKYNTNEIFNKTN